MMKYRPRHILEYAALRAVCAPLRILPYRAALALGWVLAWCAFHVVRFRVRQAESRIHEVLGDRLTRREVRRVAWLSMRNLFFNIVELLRVVTTPESWFRKSIAVLGVEPLHAQVKSGGAVVALGHSGNWEMAAIGARILELRLFSIAATQRNPLVNGELNRLRDRTGIETLAREDASLTRHVLRFLKDGKVLAIPVDLRARQPALNISFLGKQANIARGAGMFARLAGVPVFPVVITRKGWTRHQWHFHAPIRPDDALEREEDAQRITQDVMRILEEAIRAQPDQYFWYNKRWVLDPISPL